MFVKIESLFSCQIPLVVQKSFGISRPFLEYTRTGKR